MAATIRGYVPQRQILPSIASMIDVALCKLRREKALDRSADELVALVSEQVLGLLIHKHDRAVGADHNRSIRR